MTLQQDAPEIRCASCNRLLAKGLALTLSVKCPRCKALNIFTDSPRAASRAAIDSQQREVISEKTSPTPG